MLDFFPKPQMKPIPFVPHQDSYDALILSREQWQKIQDHALKQRLKGNSFTYHLHTQKKPIRTIVKTGIRAGDPILIPWGSTPRYLSTRELREVASFPIDFQLAGTYEQAFERIGNSVPPQFMQAIAEHIYQTFLDSSDKQEVQHMPLDFINKLINPDTPRLFTVVSTFSGCGGSSLGYRWAGGKVLAAIEWNENAVATYRLNFPDTPLLHRDITTVTAQEILDLTGLKPGELDILDGSPPCQGFSTAGKRQIDDPRNSLFREYVRLLRGLQPKVFVMENVSGMVKGHMKHVFAIAMRELKASGYQVKCQLMNAMYFGVPQSRERVIFIGVRNDLGIEPGYPQARAITGIVPAPETRTEAQKYSAYEIAVSIAHRKRHEAKGNGFGFLVIKPGHPSPALTKTLVKPTAHRFVDKGEHWLPSPIELSRIASYPDAFQFVGTYKDRFARIGNSVPPKFMQAIAEHIYTHILSNITERLEAVV